MKKGVDMMVTAFIAGVVCAWIVWFLDAPLWGVAQTFLLIYLISIVGQKIGVKI